MKSFAVSSAAVALAFVASTSAGPIPGAADIETLYAREIDAEMHARGLDFDLEERDFEDMEFERRGAGDATSTPAAANSNTGSTGNAMGGFQVPNFNTMPKGMEGSFTESYSAQNGFSETLTERPVPGQKANEQHKKTGPTTGKPKTGKQEKTTPGGRKKSNAPAINRPANKPNAATSKQSGTRKRSIDIEEEIYARDFDDLEARDFFDFDLEERDFDEFEFERRAEGSEPAPAPNADANSASGGMGGFQLPSVPSVGKGMEESFKESNSAKKGFSESFSERPIPGQGTPAKPKTGAHAASNKKHPQGQGQGGTAQKHKATVPKAKGGPKPQRAGAKPQRAGGKPQRAGTRKREVFAYEFDELD